MRFIPRLVVPSIMLAAIGFFAGFQTENGKVSDAPAAAPAATLKLNLAPVANMDLADVQGYDGKGGWFDQGPGSDLSGFKPGAFDFAGIPFEVADPAAHGGKAIVVLAGRDRPDFPQDVTVHVDNAAAHGYFYILHSAGWLPQKGTQIGTITFFYADGTQSVQLVVSGQDVADWYGANDLPNGIVAWTKPARGARYGLFVSEFLTLDKPVAAVTFRSERNAVWGIVGATLSSKRIPLPHKVALTTAAGGAWRPFKMSLDVVPGSALDLSAMLERPAGKYGFLTARDGHFYFEKAPDKRVKFYGTNLCYSANFPSHKDAERIAADLAAQGYNVVRFHHYDDMLTMDSKDSMTLDPGRLDRMEYLMAQCEKRGMYLVIDLFTYRQIRDGEIPEIKGAVRSGFKSLPPVLDSALNNWKTFARNILTHVNPYTGKTLATDPALIGICPVNEDPLGTVWHDSPSIAEFYNNLYAKWKETHGIVANGWNEEQAATSRFLNEIQLKGDRLYEDFLRNELHVRTPLTGANCLVAISLTEPRSHYDYVDNHIYWDHPSFPGAAWAMPYRYSQLSAIEAGAFCPRTMFPTRIKGKPFTVTEWNYCNPNRFRAEGAALMVAYAGLQDWDGLYRFAHSHDIENLKAEGFAKGFDMATDPIVQLTERVGALMFLRGDVAPAKGFVTYAVDASNGYRVTSGWGAEGFEEPVELLGLVTGVGSVWAEGADASSLSGPVTGSQRFASLQGYVAPGKTLFGQLEKNGVLPAGSVDLAKGVYKSDTGQIVLDATNGTLAISTQRGAWFVANHPATLTGAGASVVTHDGPTTVAVVSLDGKALPDSMRMLVIHLTEQVNSGEQFQTSDMKILNNWGELPHLMRAGRATLTIKTPFVLEAYALDMTGKRLHKVKVSHINNVQTIELDNTQDNEAILAYELVR
jgi:hypothetical protein